MCMYSDACLLVLVAKIANLVQIFFVPEFVTIHHSSANRPMVLAQHLLHILQTLKVNLCQLVDYFHFSFLHPLIQYINLFRHHKVHHGIYHSHRNIWVHILLQLPIPILTPTYQFLFQALELPLLVFKFVLHFFLQLPL